MMASGKAALSFQDKVVFPHAVRTKVFPINIMGVAKHTSYAG